MMVRGVNKLGFCGPVDLVYIQSITALKCINFDQFYEHKQVNIQLPEISAMYIKIRKSFY